MLSPSSPTQKSQRKEDSSGSDAGSEVGPELETDRFGFIVNNGHEAGYEREHVPEMWTKSDQRVRNDGQKIFGDKALPIVGQIQPNFPKIKPVLPRTETCQAIMTLKGELDTSYTVVNGNRILLLINVLNQVKVQCQKGIPASLRAKCWPLLCGATDRMKQNKTIYQYLDSQPALQTWVDVIRRDLDRQFPFHEMFLSKDGHGQRGLFQVLKAYTQYHPDEGYCQAQGPVAAVLLMNMPAEEAFWCLVQISEEYLPGYYSPLLEGVLFDAALLTWVLKKTSPAAHNHLQRHGVEPLMFATDWLMCLFTRHLPFNTLLRVWDLFFCHGVRVLFQVAVVLVCRVLGRAEQRKRCQGQMETLEKLRGVKQQVKEEEDSFIAEVCSVPLSARDVERQTEKELEKWRKDRPSSTFDPRVRCQGYQMAWAKIRKKEEEQNRQEREKWNLSIPLARSASTLSLSPYVLQRMVRKDRKGNIGEWQGGNKVVRHLSLGAKEDCRSWTVSRHKEMQGGREEDKHSGERKKLTGQTELTEPKRMENIPNIETDQVEGETEGVEITIGGKEEGQQPEEHKILSEITEETDEEEEPPPASSKDQNVETFLQLAAHATEEVDSYIQSQVLEQQGPKSNDTEISNKSKETERQKVEKEIRTETENDTEAETNTEQQMLMLMVPEAGVVEISAFKEPTVPTKTQEKEMTEEDSTEGKHNRSESVSEPDIGEGCNAQTATEMNEQTPLVALKEPAAPRTKVEEVIVQTDAEPHKDPETLTLCSHEGNYPEEGSDPVADIENEAEIPVSEDTAWESCSKECDTLASKPTCDIERLLAANLDQTQADETETGRNEEVSEVTSTQRKEINFISAPDCRMSSGELSTSEEHEPEHQKTQAKMEALDEEESATRGDQITSTDRKDTHVPERESHLVQGFLTQASRHRCSRSSGDYCIRKSSSYSGPRLGRRISEELFTVPHKSNQSQSIPNPSEVKHTVFQTNTSLNQTQPDLNQSSVDTVSLSGKTPERTEVEQKSSDRPNRVGLFCRLRRNQPKNNDSKGAPKMIIPQILIQDFSNGHERKVIADEVEEKLSSRERRRRRREQERRDKEEEKLRRRREKELEKAKEREGKRSQLKGKKGRKVERQDAKICSQTIKPSVSHADSYF